jgi:HlyD family secretion protein
MNPVRRLNMTTRKLPVYALCLLAGLALLAGCSSAKKGASSKASYVYATASRSTIEKTVSSSGTLEAVSSVSVLSQMNGIVEKVYADYNDRVTKGQVLVELNTDMLKLQREEQAAAVAKAQANYDLQLVAWTNQQKLADKKLISDYDLKSAKTTLDVDAAELASAKAALKVIDTEISQYAFIKSPITGIVLNKDVSVGGSVVEGSSSNSSALYTVAADLKQMQIKATVDEIDIASISKGQSVKFTVEAISGKTFTGKVKMVQLVPSTSDNVVSYNVIISIDNTDGTLLPGMTAEVEFIVSSEKDVIVVPNSALRYEPTNLTTAEIAKKVQDASLAGMTDEERAAAAQGQSTSPTEGQSSKKTGGLASLVMGGGAGGPPGGGPGGPGGPGSSSKKKSSSSSANATAATASAASAATKNLWYVDSSGKLCVAIVEAGVTDGTNTEVSSKTDLEGLKVIVKENVN